jgi:hypothetical protein
LINTRVIGNHSSGDGIIRNSGVLQITNSVVADNDATASQDFGISGGISNVGTLVVTDSTISGNRGVLIGGIRNAGSLTVLRSTISGNRSLGDAGGIGNAGALTITNSTISGNLANGSGGGLLSTGSSARVALLNATIAQNVSDEDETGGELGGGVVVLGGTLSLTNTLIAGNTTAGTQESNCTGTLTSFGHNAIANLAGCSVSAGTGDLVGVAVPLGPLQNNGGATFTHALPTGSVLIDAGDPAACPATDQRGILRPADGNRDGVARCDIGAFELGSPVRVRVPLARK